MDTKTITTRIVVAPDQPLDAALELIGLALARWLAAVDSRADVRMYPDVHDDREVQPW